MRFIKPRAAAGALEPTHHRAGRRRSALGVTALVLGVLSGTGAAYAAPGDLDASFSSPDGKLTVDFGGPERGEAVALRPNLSTPNSIAVAGHITPDDSGESFNFALALISSTGAFTANTYNFTGDSDESAFGIAVQPNDQRIVMVGNTDAGAGGWGVARLDGNVFDPGFNTIGWTTSSFPGPAGNGSVPLDVAIQDDRDIVAVGVTGANDVGDFAIARYQPTGPPDPQFSVDGDGQQTTDFSNGSDQAHAVAIQPADQKIVVAGLAGPPGDSDFALTRYTTAGSLDPSFSAPDGKLTTDFGGVSIGHDVRPRTTARSWSRARTSPPQATLPSRATTPTARSTPVSRVTASRSPTSRATRTSQTASRSKPTAGSWSRGAPSRRPRRTISRSPATTPTGRSTPGSRVTASRLCRSLPPTSPPTS